MLKSVKLEIHEEGINLKVDPVGIKGNAFRFEDFTPQQLESLKVKGDPFIYTDFTPEQIEALKVKGDTGNSTYQDWLAVGNVGTLADFFLSQKGDKGDPFLYEDFTPEQIGDLRWDLSLLQSDGSFYKDGDFIKANISTYNQQFTAAASPDFTFDFEPTLILSVFINRNGTAIIPQWTFTAPKGLTITSELIAGDILLTSYEHFIIQP